MRKTFGIAFIALLFSAIFISCKSKEEKVIDQLDKLAEQVENKSENWDSEQWEKAMNEVEKIHSEISECDFTNEQLQKLGEVEGRLTSVIIRKGIPALGKDFDSLIESAGSFVEGFQEGIQDGSEESLEQIGNYVNGALEKLKELESND